MFETWTALEQTNTSIENKPVNIPLETSDIDAQKVFKAQFKLAEKHLDEIQRREWERNSDSRRRNNGNCPKCRATEVIDAIQRLQGSGSMSGDFILGCGSISGSSSMDTAPVNRCKSCGHEWNKYETTFKSTAKVLDNAMFPLHMYFDLKKDKRDRYVYNPNDMSCKYSSHPEAAQDKQRRLDGHLEDYKKNNFVNCYPEVMRAMLKEHEGYRNYWSEYAAKYTDEEWAEVGNPIREKPKSTTLFEAIKRLFGR